MEKIKSVACDWLKKLKSFFVGVMAFLFVMVTVAGSFFVGTLAVLAGVACLFAKLIWPVFVLLALLAGIGVLLGVIVL